MDSNDTDDAVVPETQDWTWVLAQVCDQCGADVSGPTFDRVLDFAREHIDRFVDLLTTGEGVRRRPTPSTWSVTEYGAHLRDVSRVFHARVQAMIDQDEPFYPDWDPNEAARAGNYRDEDPRVVGRELSEAAHELLVAVGEFTQAELGREGHRGDGFTFTVETLMRYFLHETVHHWWDVSTQA